MKFKFKDYPSYINLYHIGDALYIPEAIIEKFFKTKLGNWLYNKLQTVYDWRCSRQTAVRIDKWDTWGADYTLSLVIHPLLIQLKEAKQGTPGVEDIDVPHIPFPIGYDVNKIWEYPELEQRWEWVIDEMIWAMGEIKSSYANEPKIEKGANGKLEFAEYYAYQDRIVRGTTLFGKYFQNLWT
jgi:hypothetical protein